MSSKYGIGHIEYLFPWDYGDEKPKPAPEPRFVQVIASPDPDLLTGDVLDGDAIFAQSDFELYSANQNQLSAAVRDVVVSDDINSDTGEVVVGDLVYDEPTGDLYKVGE